MKEYRYLTRNDELEEALYDLGYTVIENEFKDDNSFVLYTDDDLSQIFADYGVEYTTQNVEDTGWEDKWKEFLLPGWLTENVYYCFDEETESPSGRVVRIIPALAFGTGTHATTQAAARMLEPAVEGKTVADVGCGSAILAITASVCGAEKVYAFDIDDLAMGNAHDNIALNKVTNVEAWTGGIESLGERKIDVVIANIITSVLKQIHETVLSYKPEYIVYSGILQSEYDEFMKSIDLTDYKVDDTVDINEWRGVRLKKC